MIQPVCLGCHGSASDIPASLAKKIRLEYPQDRATGYSVGKLRGAVVVTRPLPKVSLLCKVTQPMQVNCGYVCLDSMY